MGEGDCGNDQKRKSSFIVKDNHSADVFGVEGLEVVIAGSLKQDDNGYHLTQSQVALRLAARLACYKRGLLLE